MFITASRIFCVCAKAASSSCRAVSLLHLRIRLSAIAGRLRSSRVILWKRPSQCVSESLKFNRSAPGTESPINSLRSLCRATKLMIGTGRSGVWASTSLASCCPSARAFAKRGKESLVPHLFAQVLGIAKQSFSKVYSGDRHLWVRPPDEIDVTTENTRLHVVGANHIVRHQ